MYLENSKTLLNISKSPSAPDSEEIVITVVISPYNFLNSRKTVSTPAGIYNNILFANCGYFFHPSGNPAKSSY